MDSYSDDSTGHRCRALVFLSGNVASSPNALQHDGPICTGVDPPIWGLASTNSPSLSRPSGTVSHPGPEIQGSAESGFSRLFVVILPSSEVHLANTGLATRVLEWARTCSHHQSTLDVELMALSKGLIRPHGRWRRLHGAATITTRLGSIHRVYSGTATFVSSLDVNVHSSHGNRLLAKKELRGGGGCGAHYGLQNPDPPSGVV